MATVAISEREVAPRQNLRTSPTALFCEKAGPASPGSRIAGLTRTPAAEAWPRRTSSSWAAPDP